MTDTATITRLPVSELVKRQLGRRLGADWSAGDRLPPLDELARMIGAGQRNTHRALRELVDEGFLVSRPGVGTFVAQDLKTDAVRARFGHEARMRSLQPGGRLRGRTIAVFCHATPPGTPAAELLQAVEAQLRNDDATVRMHVVDAHAAQHVFDDDSADGLLALVFALKVNITFNPAKVACFLRNSDRPMIAMPGRYDVVFPSGEQGGFLAGDYLRRMGHRRAAFIGRRGIHEPSRFNMLSAMRLEGFQLGFGQPVPDDCQFESERYDDRSAAKLVPRYLELPDRPRAIFAATDDLALGFILGASSHGLEPGEDYDIIGYDGQPRGRDIHGGPLSTVDVPREAMARSAARLLAERLNEPELPVRLVAHGCQLFPGNTVRPAPEAPERSAP